MTQPLLSIQIPYTKERERETANLSREFVRQVQEHNLMGLVVFELDNRGKEITIGEKRNDLYKRAKGKYVVQWDSDDWIHPQGIKLIIEALINNPDVDCCTYEEYVNIDGKEQRSNHDLKYEDWADNQDGYDYVRTPFMKSVIKSEIAKSVLVPNLRWAEDHEWSKLLKLRLKTQIHIPEQIYRYIHRSSNPTERYGLDRG